MFVPDKGKDWKSLLK